MLVKFDIKLIMIICRTPFRISFFGGGTDFPAWYGKYGGSVISTTIDKYCFINVRNLPNFFNYNYRLRYFKTEQTNNINNIKHPSFRETLKYLNFENQNVEIVHNADLPALSGMGASSSSTVCLLHALNTLKNKYVTKKQLSLDALKIEQKILKESVGSQDQIASAFGGLNYIKFNKDLSFEVNPVIKNENTNKLENSILLLFTGLQRKAEKIEKIKKKNIEKNFSFLENMNSITSEAHKMLNSKLNLKLFGNLLNEQWKLKKSLSKSVSNKIIDDIYLMGIKNGAYGGKLLGAGNGGFMMFLCNDVSKKKILKKSKKLLNIPIKFDNIGSQIIYFSRAN